MEASQGRYSEKAWRQLHKNTASCNEQILEATSSYTATCLPSLKPSKPDEQDMLDTAGDIRTNSLATTSSVSHHIDEQVLNDQLKLIYRSIVPTLAVALRTCWKRWTIETSGEVESGKSVLEAQHDDDDDDIVQIIQT